MVPKGATMSRHEALVKGLVKAQKDDDLQKYGEDTWNARLQDALIASKAAGNAVYGHGLDRWGTAADNLCATPHWDFFLPSHLNDLYTAVGPFTRPGSYGVLCDSYDVVLARFNSGLVHLRSVFTQNSGYPVNF